jgi:pimeloyl-ACP methyl ester carboxylesterase
MRDTRSKLPVLLGVTAAAATLGAALSVWRNLIAPRRHPPVGAFAGPQGARLHYVQRGYGPDLILLHGAAVNLHDMLAGPVDVLARRFRVTVFDRPGHGHSDPDLAHASPPEQAQKIHAAAAELGLERPVVAGHSLGAAVALAYGAAYPTDTAGVLLMAPLSNPVWGPGQAAMGAHVAPGAGFVLSNSLFALWDPPVMRAALHAIFAPQAPPERFLREFPFELSVLPGALRADAADFLAATLWLRRVRRDFAAYATPARILVGDEDRVLKPSRHALRLARALPNATLTTLPGMGHMLHHFAFDEMLQAAEALSLGGRRARWTESADAAAPI